MPGFKRQGGASPDLPNALVDGNSAKASVCEVVGEGLTSWSVSDDGDRVQLGFEDGAGRLSRLDLPFEALSALLLIVPRILRAALRARGNRGARVVQPLDAWRLEQAASSGCLVLTLSTRAGFDIALAVTAQQLSDMSGAAGRTEAPKITLN